MKIDKKWEAQFADVGSLKDLAGAQQNTITQQSKKITELERELTALRSSTSIVPIELPSGIDMYSKDEEFIARYELSKFKNLSLQRSLTAEETKQIDTYAKLLIQLNAQPKKDIVDTTALPLDQLLSTLAKDDE